MSAKFDEIIRNRRKFNGKPLAHWQEMADEIVIDALVRAAMQHLASEHASLPGYIAGQRLMEIAKAENPTMLEKVLAIRAACIQGFQRIMADIFS